ncbi:MAG: DUF3611 family protein [Thermostichus sp. DG_1_6_bins_120]
MNEPMSPSVRAAVERMKSRLRLTRRFGFWFQAVLGATALLLWLGFLIGQNTVYRDDSAGAVIAFWFTLFTLLTLAAGLFFNWRYLLHADRRQASADSLSQLDLPKQLQLVTYVSLIGAFLALIGMEAQVGELLARMFSRTQANQVTGVLLLAANINVTFAHFVCLAGVLWITGALDREP